MSPKPRNDDGLMPPDLAAMVDEACDLFKSALKAGQRPPLEQFLEISSEPYRTALFRELLGVELDYRRRGGESPGQEEYLAQFPEFAVLIDALLPTPPNAPSAEENTVNCRRKRIAAPYKNPSSGIAVPAVSNSVRFLRLREHAKGGMGEVFVAHDVELNREVALKEIQDRYVDRPEARTRFLREAEITGKLEHPGVVPVYGLGSYPDGRPFYAMRFIRGESMQEAIDRFHKADEQPRRDPSERSLALRDLLGRFVAVCNTVAYAHARAAIHRDLKPANVMLGEYGESLVVDWGLARLLDRFDGEPTTVERPISAGAAAARHRRKWANWSAHRHTCLRSRRKGCTTESALPATYFRWARRFTNC